jgi:hypothetical protein
MGTVVDENGYATYVLTLNGTINITYRFCFSKYGSDVCAHDHYEFLSYLVSDTGYLSHFVNAAAVDAAGGHRAYAEQFCNSILGDKVNTNQFDLFEGCY